MGVATESPVTIDGYVEHVSGWGSDGDGLVTKVDFEGEFPQSQPFADV